MVSSKNTKTSTNDKKQLLTSDLPSRNRRGKKTRSEKRNLIPAFLIIIVGITTFMITNVYQKRSDSRAFQDQYERTVNQTPVITEEPIIEEPSVVLVEKDFATVLSNQVGFLNVRQEPSTASARLGQLDIGDKVEVLEVEDTWVKIKLEPPLSGETEGWVSSDYIEISTEEVEQEAS